VLPEALSGDLLVEADDVQLERRVQRERGIAEKALDLPSLESCPSVGVASALMAPAGTTVGPYVT